MTTLLRNWSEGAPRTILLATDRSARCDRPLDRSVQLAHAWGARLVVLHVVERLPAGVDAEALVSSLKSKLFSEVPTQTPFTIEVRTGAVGETVLATAEQVGADLIVTGVSRCNELGDYVLGTTVERLVRHSRVPVLVVKERPRTRYAKLLIATDYSDCSAAGLEVLPAFPHATATLMHAYHVPYEGFVGREANEDEFGELNARAGAAFLKRLTPQLRDRLAVSNRYGPSCEVLIRAAHEEGFDLAIVCTHGGGGLGRVLIGSTAEALLGCLPCDILLVPVSR